MPSSRLRSAGSTSLVCPDSSVFAERRRLARRHAAREPVGGVGRDEPRVRRGAQRRRSSRSCAAPGRACACCELQQLHEPLDVAERPRAELQVARGIGALRQALVLDARLDALDLAQALRIDGCRIPHLVGERREVADELDAAGDAARTQQRLRLPGQRPAAVVLGVGVERAGDGAVAALGPKVGVEVERHAMVFGVLAQAGDELEWRARCARCGSTPFGR